MKNIVRRIQQTFTNIDAEIAGFASFISASISAVLAIFYFFIAQNGRQKYTDIVYDYLAMDGAYKSADIKTFYILIFSFALIFVILYAVLKQKDFHVRTITGNRAWAILMLIPIAFYFLIHFQLSVFTLLFLTNIFIFCITAIGHKKDFVSIRTTVFGYIYFFLAVTGIKALVQFCGFLDTSGEIDWFGVAALLGCCLFTCFWTRLSKTAWSLISSLQIFVPLNILGIINTKYLYHEEQVFPEYLDKFKYIILAIWILNEIICIYSIITRRMKGKQPCLCISSIISFLAIQVWNSNYDLVINTDTFHTGETAVVYNQTINFGQGWGEEFSSILQGLGFLISGINEWIFEGKFAMYLQSQNFLLLCIAILLGFGIYSFVKDSAWLFIYLAFAPALLMDRAYLIVPTFLILMNKVILKNIYIWTYVYILLCILNVFYQPTYGGAVCAALFIPCCIFWKDEIKQRKTKLANFFSQKRQLIFLFSVLIIGVACIPLLIQAITFLVENGSSTETANGITIIQSARYFPLEQGISSNKYLNILMLYLLRYALGPIIVMSFFYYFFVYGYRIKDIVVKKQIQILCIGGGVSYILMLSASFNRIDSGLSRIGNINCTYSVLLLLLLVILWKELKGKAAASLLIGCMCFSGLYINGFPLIEIFNKVATTVEIPEQAMYVTEEEHGLKNLGNVYIEDEIYLYEAKIVNEICQRLLNENQTYYDCLDKSIYYNFTDKPVPGYHVAQYTIGGNTLLQKKAISCLQSHDVPLIFARGLQTTSYMSKRCFVLYRYLMELDYNLIEYKGCQFLVRQDVDLEPIANDLLNTKWQWLINSTSLENCMTKLKSSGDLTEERKQIKDISNTEGADAIILCFDNAEVLLGSVNVKSEGNSFGANIEVQPGEQVILPTFMFEKPEILVSENLLTYITDVKFMWVNEDARVNLDVQIDAITEEIEMDKINEAFATRSMGYTAEEWGMNLTNMRDNFIRTKDLSSGIVYEKDGGITINGQMQGSEAEFLFLQLENEEGDFAATAVIKGIDKNGDEFSENIDVGIKYENSALLIPIGTSPNVLLSSNIDTITLYFSDSGFEISEAAFYKFY